VVQQGLLQGGFLRRRLEVPETAGFHAVLATRGAASGSGSKSGLGAGVISAHGTQSPEKHPKPREAQRKARSTVRTRSQKHSAQIHSST
jgi:hypothetical protein